MNARGIVLVGFTLVLTVSCDYKATTVLKSSCGPAERRITIVVSDDGAGGYKLEPATPDIVYICKGKKARWTVINNTRRAEVESVVIDSFESDDKTEHEPFEGGPAAQRFKFERVHSSLEQQAKSRESRLPPNKTEVNYKYKITVTIATVLVPLTQDPRIIIGN